MELGGTMNLKEYIDKRNSIYKPLTIPEIMKIFTQVLEAIKHLHTNYLVHLDIKAENISIIEKTHQIKIVDFGFAMQGKEIISDLDIHCGTPCYMAPEFYQRKIYDGRHIDMWAAGVLFHFMITSQFPFNGKSEKEMSKKVLDCNWNKELVSSKHKSSLKILERTFVLSGKQRPTAEDLLKSKIFEKYL